LGLPIQASGDYAGAGGHALAGPYGDFPLRSEEDVAARAEFDQADALADGDVVAGLFSEDDAACDQAGDLFEDHGGAIAGDGDDVLFVIARALFTASHQELALLVLDLLDGAADGCAVHVNVENVQKDTQAVEPALGFDGDHFAVGGRDGDRPGGNLAFGIAEEIEAEERQQGHWDREPGSDKPEDKSPRGAECERVVDTSGYDPQTTIFAWAEEDEDESGLCDAN
jgi:hypothetical protein